MYCKSSGFTFLAAATKVLSFDVKPSPTMISRKPARAFKLDTSKGSCLRMSCEAPKYVSAAAYFKGSLSMGQRIPSQKRCNNGPQGRCSSRMAFVASFSPGWNWRIRTPCNACPNNSRISLGSLTFLMESTKGPTKNSRNLSVLAVNSTKSCCRSPLNGPSLNCSAYSSWVKAKISDLSTVFFTSINNVSTSFPLFDPDDCPFCLSAPFKNGCTTSL
mmetsp:Transcript_115109/g.325257  ORF Transcript_115109/g.325257 Transcript_115109/m.325257 type:complete len:217 (-) Transcript_115109:373-1023(-)